MAARRALFATVHLREVVVDEVRVTPGTSLEIGPRGLVKLPVPEGVEHVCLAHWTPDGRAVVVEDGQGSAHTLAQDDALDIRMGPVRVHLEVVRQFAIRRTHPIAWMFSLTWFLTMFAVFLGSAQVEHVWSKRCVWFGIDCPREVASAGGVNAEYLARLLREDYAGEDDGVEVAEERTPRPVVMPSGYLPSGDPYGPKDEMGGAEQVAPKPVKAPPKPVEDVAPAPRKPDPPKRIETVPVGEPVVQPEPEPETPEGASDDPDGVSVEEPAEEPPDAPADEAAEEEEGFGLSDWLDMSPEERKIELMLELARRKLRIDPDDPDALSLLAYYQYLADDLEGAEASYDKIIDILPESAAAYNNKALVYKRRGEYGKEEGLYRVALALEPDDTTAMNNLAVNLSHQGKHAEALAIMDRLEALLPDDPYSDLHRAKIHAQMGEDETALSLLERALAGMQKLDTLHHIEFRQDIRVDPSFSRLRDSPRFRGILKRYYGEDTPLQD